jgi:hypothetical protein
MSKAWKQMVCLAWVLACAPLASAFGDTQFARVDTDDDDRPRALQLGIISYVFPDNQDGISVDLVGAIHIGDKAYYAELNERFRQYDALLYELVAPAGANVSEQVEKRKGLLSSAQIGMTKILDLSFQLDEIDYSQPNFVHADLTPSEFSQSMAERDESLYVYFWRIVFASIDEYAKDPLGLRDWQMLSAMLKSREDASLKIMMAYEMANMESVQDILGDDSSSAIVGARNQRAIEVLRGQLDAGARRIGIFYGVAHMADLEDRLVNELGLRFDSTSWVDAWQLGGD